MRGIFPMLKTAIAREPDFSALGTLVEVTRYKMLRDNGSTAEVDYDVSTRKETSLTSEEKAAIEAVKGGSLRSSDFRLVLCALSRSSGLIADMGSGGLVP